MLRQFFYEYHRQGLDLMADNQDEGRANIATALTYLEQAKKSRSDLFILQLIADAKRDEIINIFSKGSPQEKTKVANIMREVDPANANKYEKSCPIKVTAQESLLLQQSLIYLCCADYASPIMH